LGRALLPGKTMVIEISYTISSGACRDTARRELSFQAPWVDDWSIPVGYTTYGFYQPDHLTKAEDFSSTPEPISMVTSSSGKTEYYGFETHSDKPESFWVEWKFAHVSSEIAPCPGQRKMSNFMYYSIGLGGVGAAILLVALMVRWCCREGFYNCCSKNNFNDTTKDYVPVSGVVV